MAYKNKKKQNNFQNEWIQARRFEWIALQGGKCVQCGSAENLEVDHINRQEKTLKPSQIWSRRKEVREVELLKCQVLCYHCHKIKTINEFTKPLVHGTLNGYRKHKCKCFDCMEWMREDSRRKRAAQRLRKLEALNN